MPDAAVIFEIPYIDPASAFAPLAGRAYSILLESADSQGPQGRYSYIAADPFRVLTCSSYPWRVAVDGRVREGNPFDILAEDMRRFAWKPETPVPFSGGAVGFFSYELGGVLEKLPVPKTTPLPLDMAIGLYDVVAAFDHRVRKAWIIAREERRAVWLKGVLGNCEVSARSYPRVFWRAESRRNQHEGRVAAAIEAIRAGDIYQANVTQRFHAPLPEKAAPFDIYLNLRERSPAPFAAFINGGNGLALISASPERFLKCDANGRVETRPIKGTRPRGKTLEEDRAHAEALKASAKDISENLMIVDLLRNDLARVCVPGSVEAPVLCGLETFASVHHLVSVVTGQLRETAGASDLLKACFPGGSITGAPKIRAMEIIHDLEPSARGPYCGAIAWLGFDGAMDSSIVIRTLVLNGGEVAAQAGGGIVADSDPAAEYEESLAKAAPLIATLGTL
ncbi:MAG: aminodeoxychorismate synthase component I [Proteobacteria bacterium]|nr:aminodeoxychorismate synthase component I [Pseudomonadota bacterium]